MIGDQKANQTALSRLLLLVIGIALSVLLIEVGMAIGNKSGNVAYMDCVDVVFVDDKTTPKTYKTTVLSRTDEDRLMLDSADGVVKTLQSRTPFYFIASDMESYTVKEGNCYAKQ